MKKIFFLTSMLLIANSALILAQNDGCVEVRGVETSRVTYQKGGSDNRTYYGYQFTNNNSFVVSIDADRWLANPCKNDRGEMNPPYIKNSKSFDLKPGETYLWKVDMWFDTSNYRCDDYNPDNNYVKFKALKCPR